MSSLRFRPVAEFSERAESLFVAQHDRIQRALPDADVQHVGSTAVKGSITKGDLDINVRVPAHLFSAAVGVLTSLYAINQAQNWDEYFASFKDERSYDLDLGIQLTVMESPADDFVWLRDLLNGAPWLVRQLNELKDEYQGGDMDHYRTAKAVLLQNMKDRAKAPHSGSV